MGFGPFLFELSAQSNGTADFIWRIGSIWSMRLSQCVCSPAHDAACVYLSVCHHCLSLPVCCRQHRPVCLCMGSLTWHWQRVKEKRHHYRTYSQMGALLCFFMFYMCSGWLQWKNIGGVCVCVWWNYKQLQGQLWCDSLLDGPRLARIPILREFKSTRSGSNVTSSSSSIHC